MERNRRFCSTAIIAEERIKFVWPGNRDQGGELATPQGGRIVISDWGEGRNGKPYSD